MFLEQIGAPSKRYFRRHGLPAYCNKSDAHVPLQRAWSLFGDAAQREDPMLGWHVGRFVGNNDLDGGLVRRLRNSPTLYQALQSLVRRASEEASHLKLGIVERKDHILLCSYYSDNSKKREPGYAQSQAYQLELFLGLIRRFVGRDWVPDAIGVEHSTVKTDVRDSYPGSRVLTHQRMGFMAVPRSCLHRAVRTGGAEEGEDSMVTTGRFEFLDTLRALLETYLADGYPSARFAASLMDISERSLARRLAARGLTYGAFIDALRFSVAKELLCDPAANIIDVARSVGFDDASHFARMFRRIGGLSPREFRNAVRAKPV
jgi:AraC-like DNA-binding protein